MTTLAQQISDQTADPLHMLRPGRKIHGYSAVLLPFDDNHQIDWPGFEALLKRTVDAGLVPAVNMDTGFGNLIDDQTKSQVLALTAEHAPNEFCAGAFVADKPGDAFDLDAYRRAMEPIVELRGTPVIFQSYGLTDQSSDGIVNAYTQLGEHTPRFIAFELGKSFAPFGQIYDLPTYEQLVKIPQCIGAKHSSLDRMLEWQRLILRDRIRPDFKVFTGNDRAIDMVMFGSDYLLGLSAFAPDLFAKRDRAWEAQDPAFFQLNDDLQYLGQFAFRDPVPAYKHNAAMFLHLTGWIASANTHPQSATRPDADVDVLREMAQRLNLLPD